MLNKYRAAEKDRIRVGTFWQKRVEQLAADDPRLAEHLPAAGTPLPSGAATCFVTTEDGAVWLGSDNGLTRCCEAEPYCRDRVQFFTAPRWLPDPKCLALAADGRGVWVRTETGGARIWMEEITYETKAAEYDSRICRRQLRHDFVTEPHFAQKDDWDHWRVESSDNDGLWTAMYAAGACFEYAVTGSEDSHMRARRTVNAVLSLVDVTGRPGYPARSFVVPGEKVPEDGLWIPREDGVIWKSDTSSDELVGHFMIYLLAHELLPDEDIRRRTAEAAAAIADHIMANGRYLSDVTGKPTRWGRWSKEYFDGFGHSDQALNAAELLAGLKVAAFLTGEPRFAEQYRSVALDDGYADIVCTYLESIEELNFSDEELGYLSYLPLVLLEDDPFLRGRYREAMGQWWQNIRREANPLWTYIYKLIAPEVDYDMESCLWTLRRMPWDMRYSSAAVETRADVTYVEDTDRFGKRQIVDLLAPDERRIMKWNSNPFVPESGGGFLAEEPGTVYTFPYWLGRYFGFIEEA
ncbi:MAG: hypothetical protein IJL69_02905 [Oscillospiraceae bacterium]|nr:hypothetical protein [Oscillospiraceae bacterium]